MSKNISAWEDYVTQRKEYIRDDTSLPEKCPKSVEQKLSPWIDISRNIEINHWWQYEFINFMTLSTVFTKEFSRLEIFLMTSRHLSSCRYPKKLKAISLKIVHTQIFYKRESTLSADQFGFRNGLGTREALLCYSSCYKNTAIIKKIFTCFINYVYVISFMRKHLVMLTTPNFYSHWGILA